MTGLEVFSSSCTVTLVSGMVIQDKYRKHLMTWQPVVGPCGQPGFEKSSYQPVTLYAMHALHKPREKSGAGSPPPPDRTQ